MTGNKRRGLSDFLGKELKSSPSLPPAPPPRAEPERRAPKSQTSRVTESVRPASSPAPEPEAVVEVVVAPSFEAAVIRPEVPKSVSSRVDPEVPKSVSPEVPEGPLYMRLTRKEVRFRDDQLEALDRIVRRIARARRGHGGERITENTLVRVAVDLFLERADALAGGTEAELLKSLRRK